MAYRNTFFRWLFLYSLTFGLTYVLKLFTYLCPETGQCPDTSRRSCRRKRNGKGGTCRIWPECRCIRAAGGIRICLVRQILPSLPVPFSSTASNRSLYGLFTSRHCPASSRTHLVIRCCIQTVVKSSFPRGALVR